MKNLKTKTTLVIALFALSIFSTNAQINLPKNNTIKNIKLKKNNPANLKLNLPNADATIMDIISGADEGTYKITMASLTVTKYVSSYSSYVGSRSYSTVSSSNKFFSLRKYNELTAEGSFFVNGSRKAANVRIYTTKFGGKQMTIKHTEGVNTSLIQIKNLKITKKGAHRYIITGDSEKKGNITNYIFNIYRYVIQ